MNKTKELLEVIEGFQNLTAKIKDDNDSIKTILKNKDLTINECKIAYRKLYTEHEQLKNEYSKLKSKMEENENEKSKDNKRKRKKNANNRKKKKILIDFSSDENDNNESKSSEEEEEEEEDSDFEIVKVKKNKKKTKQKKVEKVKGIMDYINSRKK